MNVRKRAVIVVVVGVGVVAVVVWLALRARHNPPRSAVSVPGSTASTPSGTLGSDSHRFAGKWTFVDGAMKTDWDIRTSDAPKHELSLVGRSMTVLERDGALWTAMEGDRCVEMLSLRGANVAELVAGRSTCPDQAVDGGKKSTAKLVRMTISLDASGRGHVQGTSQFSLEVSGVVHEGHLDFDGVADKQAGPGH